MSTFLSTASTDDVDPADRLEFWEDYTASKLVGLRCSTYRPDGLRAQQVNADLGECRLAALDCSAHVVDRSMQQVRKSPKDSVLISILLEGTAFFHHASGSRALRAGDAIVYNADEPYLFAFDTDMRKFILDFPRELLGGAHRARSSFIKVPMSQPRAFVSSATGPPDFSQTPPMPTRPGMSSWQ